jgi:hypothetical protein
MEQREEGTEFTLSRRFYPSDGVHEAFGSMSGTLSIGTGLLV